MRYADIIYWNERSYGMSVRIPRSAMVFPLIMLCLLTPFTNWMIPFVLRIIRRGFILRFS